MMRHFPLLTAAALAAFLPAQKAPLPDGTGRIAQLIDLEPLLRSGDAAAVADDAIAAAGNAAPRATRRARRDEGLGRLAAFLRRIADPPLGEDDDVQPLAGRWLAVVGTPAQVASLERAVQDAVRRRGDLVDIAIQLFEVPAAFFAEHVKKGLVAVEQEHTTLHQGVLDAKAAAALLERFAGAEVNSISAPRLCVAPLQTGTLATGEQIAYVKDFELEVREGAVIANPVIGVLWNGIQAEVIAALAPDGGIAVSCDVTQQDVAKPIPEMKTTLPGSTKEVTVQLPRTTGVRLQQTAHLRDGDAVVLAAPKVGDSYVIAVVSASLHR